MEDLKKILDNKILYLISLVILAILFLNQCEKTKHAENESQRNFNNYIANQDSVRIISSKYGNILAEKSALELKYGELNEDQKKLIERLEIEKKKKPKVVIQTQVEYRDSSILVPVRNVGNQLEFKYNPTLPDKNELSISGKIPFNLKIDSVKSADRWVYSHNLITGDANLSISQKIDLVTGLYKDPKTGRVFVRASTTFPGVNFSDMQALDMADSETKKAMREARKTFGVGAFAGVGAGVGSGGFVLGPVVGVGLTYQPKWLQFGK